MPKCLNRCSPLPYLHSPQAVEPRHFASRGWSEALFETRSSQNTVTKWNQFMLWPSLIILASNSIYILERALSGREGQGSYFGSEQFKSQGFGTLFRWQFHRCNQELDFALALKSFTDIQSIIQSSSKRVTTSHWTLLPRWSICLNQCISGP